jgi:predicted nucleotidyltransferase
MLMTRRPSNDKLKRMIEERVSSSLQRALIDNASEIVVFGSVAAGLSRAQSDLDLLVISGTGSSNKSPRLDIVGLSVENSESYRWRSSELASHIYRYGIWLGNSKTWEEVRLSQDAIDAKERRVRAFLSALPRSWNNLDETFKTKYAYKLRRESQRLILMESNIPIPPTRVLDEAWEENFGSENSVLDRLHKINPSDSNQMFDDLLKRIHEHFVEMHGRSVLLKQ